MSEINLVFTVNSVSSTFTVDSRTINVTPTTTALNMFAGAAAYPPNGASGNSQVLFNDAGVFGGNVNLTYNKTTNTLTSSNIQTSKITTGNLTVSGNATLGSVSNVHITGGTSGQFLKTDGAGNLTFVNLQPGGTSGQLQFNDNGSFAGLSTATVSSGNLSFGSLSNVKIVGGQNGYFIQTDGAGNLSWSAFPGGAGGTTVAGSNTQVQFNTEGSFDATPAFAFNKSSNTLSVESMAVYNTATFTGTTKIQQGTEKATISSSSLSGNINWDILSGAVIYNTTNMSGNISLNFRGNLTTTLTSMLSVGDSLTVALLTTSGSTPYMPTSIKIDGATQTVKYSGNTPPSINTIMANSVTSYNYTIIKTGASTFLTLGTYSSFKG